MESQAVDNEWFVATFPGKVEVELDESDPLARVVGYTAELEPFGIFSIRVTNMRIDAFVAVGATRWIGDFGDRIVAGFADRNPEVVLDELRDPAPGLRVRDLVFRFEYEGPCGCFGRVMGITGGEQGRVLEATALVDWSPKWKEAAFAFLDGIQVSVSAPAWRPET